jgi:hypothetical protein
MMATGKSVPPWGAVACTAASAFALAAGVFRDMRNALLLLPKIRKAVRRDYFVLVTENRKHDKSDGMTPLKE